MAGVIHITRLGSDRDAAGAPVGNYQVNYNVGNSSYLRVYDEEHLQDFLKSVAVLDQAELARVSGELHTAGSSTVADVDIPVQETAALGMERIPSEY